MRVSDMRLWIGGAGLAACLALSGCGSDAGALANGDADWRAQVQDVKMGIRGAEEDPTVLRRWEAFRDIISDATDLPVRAYEASDYNGVIQAMASGQIDLATMGAGSYANVDAQIGELGQPILTARDSGGESGYYSTIAVRAESPYQSIEDLEGKTLAFVDFNSTSGYIYPRWRMRADGIDPERFFGQLAMAGGHLQAAMALANGQFDATVLAATNGNPERGFSSGSLRRMAERGLVDLDAFREIWFAGPIPNSPIIIRSDRPEAFKDLVRGALAAIPYDDPAAALDMGRGPGSDYRAVNRDFYEEIIDMRTEEIASHRIRLSERSGH